MRMLDVNVLIYAHREDAHPEHHRYLDWLTALATGHEPWALTPMVISGLVRIVTNKRFFTRPSTLAEVFAFTDALVERRSCRIVNPSTAHLPIFRELCDQVGASGKLVADAYHAAVAIEHGCVWVSTDADFSRFPDLRYEHPLAPR